MQQQQMQQQQMQQQQIQYNQDSLEKASNPNNGNIIEMLNNHNKDDVLKTLNMYAQKNNEMNKQPQPKQLIKSENTAQMNDMNNGVNEYLNDLSKKQLEQLKQVQQLQEQLQIHLQKQMLSSGNVQKSHPNNDDFDNSEIKSELISKVKILTGQLEEEKKTTRLLKQRLDETLEKKTDENQKKLEMINQKKQEIKKEVLTLSKKHKDIENLYNNLINKEKVIASVIEKNKILLQLDNKTFFINSKDFRFLSKITYNFEQLKNINKIELISYEFPLISNNINDINNKLHYKIDNSIDSNIAKESDSEEVAYDDDEDILVIPNGNYDISTLIKKLNKISKGINLIFSYNKNTSKVTIRNGDDKEFSLFYKDESILSILGFEDNELTGKSFYISENSYNLQKSSYIYVHLPNIRSESMANININNTKNNSYYIDTENITLDNIDIEIKDENDNIIDFCNLSYKLEFKIYFSNEDLKIEDTPNIENIMDSDDSESNLSIDSPDVSISNIQASY